MLSTKLALLALAVAAGLTAAHPTSADDINPDHINPEDDFVQRLNTWGHRMSRWAIKSMLGKAMGSFGYSILATPITDTEPPNPDDANARVTELVAEEGKPHKKNALGGLPGWTLIDLRTVDHQAGRYAQLMIPQSSGPPLMAYNSYLDGLRTASCRDRQCSSWTTQTVHGADPDPRFIRAELTADGVLMALWVGQNNTAAVLGCCSPPACGTMRTSMVSRADRMRPVGLALRPGRSALGAVAGNVPSGSGSAVTLVEMDCDGRLGEPLVVASSEPWQVDRATLLPVSGLEMGALIAVGDSGAAVLYWDITARSLVLALVDITASLSPRKTIVASNRSDFVNPGAFARMVRVTEDTLVVTFFDLPGSSLYVSCCRLSLPDNSSCAAPVRVASVGLPDMSNLGAGGFPDLQLDPNTGHAVLLYFNESSASDGCLCALRCTEQDCSVFENTRLQCGPAGFGRDASMQFFAGNGTLRAAVAFLDLDGKDEHNATLMRLGYIHETVVAPS